MIHHLIGSSPYTTRFVKLLEAHPGSFPPAEHCFWIERRHGSPFQVATTGRLRRIDVGSWGFLRAFLASSPADRFVIHQLSNPRLLLFLFVFRFAAGRCAWSIWGGDVYYFQYRPRTWLHALRERIRQAVIPTIPVISSMIPGDFETVRNVYGSRAKYVAAFYPIPMDYSSLEGGGAHRPGESRTILVGNSGDPANEHAWVLRALSRLQSEHLHIVSPLSYGDPEYVARVIALGRELFGERFTPLTEFQPPEQYAGLMRDVDAAIMNHGYQQALGNIIALLMMGKKVYVRSDTTPFRYFNDLGITVYDTLRVEDLELSEILAFAPDAGTRNAEALRSHLSEANAVAGWKDLLNAVRGQA